MQCLLDLLLCYLMLILKLFQSFMAGFISTKTAIKQANATNISLLGLWHSSILPCVQQIAHWSYIPKP